MPSKSIHLSQYFGIPHSAFVEHGVYDALLGEDSRLHIDPLLLKGTSIPEFKEGYAEFLKRFSDTAHLVPHVRVKSLSDRFYRQICNRLTFKELANTGLGFSKNGGHGTGISGTLTKQLANSVIDIEKAGIKDPEIYALMPVIEENIGPDRISDMIFSILFEEFIRYTSSKLEELGITTHTRIIEFEFGKFRMPIYNKVSIKFVPQSFLCELPEAHSWDDIERVDNYNRRIREQVCKAIGIALKDAHKIKKNDLKDYLLSHPKVTEDVLTYYKSLSGVPYDFSRDKSGEYIRAIVNEMRFPTDLGISHIANIDDVRNVTYTICQHYRTIIENNRMYTLFRDSKTEKYSETNAQLLFFCMAEAYCNANNIDLTRESDAGWGELDFKLSQGASAKVLIEMKLSSNTQLEKGLTCQLPAYMQAEKGHYGILMILLTHDKDLNRVNQVLEQNYLANANGNSVKDVMVIDARFRPSASKLK